MIVIQDTCTILMLIRIAPRMFTDKTFECMTLRSIVNEVTRTTRFKYIYPWRKDFLHCIIHCPETDMTRKGFHTKRKHVENLCHLKQNPKTGRFYISELSPADIDVATALLCEESILCSVDRNLAIFAENELDVQCITPLALVNNWIEKRLILWDDQLHAFVSEWIALKEPRQPQKEIERFERLTSRTYPR